MIKQNSNIRTILSLQVTPGWSELNSYKLQKVSGWDFPGSLVVKNLPSNAGDVGLIPGSGRSPRERNGNPLQYSCLGNPLDTGTWQATVYGISKESSRTQLRD